MNRKSITRKIKTKIKKINYLIPLFYLFSGVAYTTYHNQLPQDIVGWILVCIKFILLVTILFGIQYFITVLAWNKSIKFNKYRQKHLLIHNDKLLLFSSSLFVLGIFCFVSLIAMWRAPKCFENPYWINIKKNLIWKINQNRFQFLNSDCRFYEKFD